MHSAEYKAEKEASVSFLGGGGKWEINHVTLVAPAAYFLWAMLQSRQKFFTPYTLPAALTDFLLQCCAILFATTVYADGPQILNGLLVLPALATYLQPARETKTNAGKPSGANGQPADAKEDGAKSAEQEKDPLPMRPFITAYRGAMMIITCTSILAVDFPVFPRRFAKTEAFGTSLMDLGVGSFVFASGIVSARQMLKEEYAESAPTMLARLKAAIRHALPLFVLGLIRLWTVKGLEYAEHVSEYGVHWNFFFTLALLSPTIAIMQPLLSYVPSLNLLAFAIGCCYEMLLYWTPHLKEWIILSPRDPNSWFSQNREGVYSFIGYLAIFICGMGMGRLILPRDKPWDLFPTRPVGPAISKREAAALKPNQDTMDDDEDWLMEVMGHTPAGSLAKQETEVNPLLLLQAPQTAWFGLAKWTFLWFIFAGWGSGIYGPYLYVSRRMANLGYVVWVCAFNVAQLGLFNLIEMLLFPKLYDAKDRATERSNLAEATSSVLRAFNRNGLVLFLLANLLTGAINLSVETWHVDEVSAMAILVAYVATICGVALTLDYYDMSIKL